MDSYINKRNMQELRIKKMGKNISELNGRQKQDKILKLKEAKSVLKRMDDLIDTLLFYDGKTTEEERIDIKNVFNSKE